MLSLLLLVEEVFLVHGVDEPADELMGVMVLIIVEESIHGLDRSHEPLMVEGALLLLMSV